jgi:DNA-binding NarL/FixJ family response regulator
MLGQEPELGDSSTTCGVEGWLEHVDETHPDLVLLDWDLPDLKASALLCALGKKDCIPKVVVFSQQREACREALNAGATAFVCREDPVEHLLITLRQVSGISPVFVD